jgi:hypothetical protein
MSVRRPHHPDRLLVLAPVGIHHADMTGICTWVNERWSELTGVPHAEHVAGRVQAALSEASSLTGESFTTTASVGSRLPRPHRSMPPVAWRPPTPACMRASGAGRGRISSAGAHADAA